jgi:hypothetical protein
VVRAKQKHGDMGSLLPGNAAVNMHPQQWETVFSVGSMQRSYLKNKRRYEFRSEFSVEDSVESLSQKKNKNSACEDLVCE